MRHVSDNPDRTRRHDHPQITVEGEVKYIVTLVAHFEIEAESVVHARKASKSIRAIGERIGRGRSIKERDLVPYSVRRISEMLTLPARIAKGKT